ncbi:hypothetical protein [Bacillus phage YungSlug]|nr:hypothetical protein [Bacillus phage YungSlug]
MKSVKKSRAMGLSTHNWPINTSKVLRPDWKYQRADMNKMFKELLKDYLTDCQEIGYRRNECERQIRYTLSWRRPWHISQARQLGKGGYANPEEVANNYYRELLFHLHKWG